MSGEELHVMRTFALGDKVHDGFNYGRIVQVDEKRTPPLYLVEVQLWPRERPITTWRQADAIQHADEYAKRFQRRDDPTDAEIDAAQARLAAILGEAAE